MTFRLANNSLEPTWPAHGYRLRDTSLGLAKRLSSQPLDSSIDKQTVIRFIQYVLIKGVLKPYNMQNMKIFRSSIMCEKENTVCQLILMELLG